MDSRSEKFLISGVKPTMLSIIEPEVGQESECSVTESNTADCDAASCLLSLASCVFSQLFLLMKSIMTRERVIARAEYEHNTGRKVSGNMPYSKVPCVKQPLTSSELSSLSAYESVIRTVFGNEAADFAHERFIRAISTGDKRSFKIRFLFYKASDGLKNPILFDQFRIRMEDAVTEAEEKAGCTPDPSPRRMSNAEKERKRRKDMEPKQIDLFDYVALSNASGDQEKPDSECNAPAVPSVVNSNECPKSNKTSENSESRKVENPAAKQLVVRKTKVYESCSELLEDIKSGSVTPYQKNAEVIEDVKQGLITMHEAVIFLAELGKRNNHKIPVVWGNSRMPSENISSEDISSEDSPSDSELEYIEESENKDEGDDGGIYQHSERGFFNEQDQDINDDWQ